MILTAIGFGATAGQLYPDFVGKRATFVGSGPGPASYVQGGDPVTLNVSNYYIDALCGGVFSVSGTYYVLAIPSGVGPRQTWKLIWKVAATNAEVGAAVNLSAESVQLGAFVGQF